MTESEMRARIKQLEDEVELWQGAYRLLASAIATREPWTVPVPIPAQPPLTVPGGVYVPDQIKPIGFVEPTDEERTQNRLTNVDHPLHLLKAT